MGNGEKGWGIPERCKPYEKRSISPANGEKKKMGTKVLGAAPEKK